MRDKVFVDTNIVIDLLAVREPFYEEAKKLFQLAEKNKIEIQLSSITFINIQYILRKQIGKDRTKNIIQGIRLITSICNVGEKEVDLALISEMKDFEDAVQYYTARNNKSEVIITRNLKDFKKSKLPVMTAEEYLNS